MAGTENKVADDLSRITQGKDNEDIPDAFPEEHLYYAKGSSVLIKLEDVSPQLTQRPFLMKYGIPRAIISDQGTHFCNRAVEALMRKYRVNHCLSTPYHPQSNGEAEILNREIKSILEITVSPSRKDWSKRLDDAL
ncbi:uncharacterized protein LOC121757650 [Salvia splendens]|uniref:uncharacterized protein LOC121757650 n=1 Tax=Salvia splendens TaxID=180675 RepID=UPI001C260CB7|nr:uncharacterized protein LOC121757650 [Salvia splendens]